MMRIKMSSRRALGLIDKQIGSGYWLRSEHDRNIEATRMQHSSDAIDVQRQALTPLVDRAIADLGRWENETHKIITSIFTDERPRIGFLNAKYIGGLHVGGSAALNRWFQESQNFDAKLSFLCELYDDLKPLVRVPLQYIDNQRRLMHNEDSIILDGPQQAAFCAFMFQQEYGVPVETEDIYREVYADLSVEEIPVGKVWSLAEEINKKTRWRWSFALFHPTQGKRQITLIPPPPVSTFPQSSRKMTHREEEMT
jgi:hypothetical protein